MSQDRKKHGSEPAPNQSSRGFVPLALVVVTSGAVLMGLEIVGSRVLAPSFGTSVFVWGSLISIFLFSLAAGYFAGGLLSESWPSYAVLNALSGAAALLILAIPFVAPAVCHALLDLGWVEQRGPLLAATILFLPPSFLLGTVSPFAVRLAARTMATVGRTAGSLYALSTLGSILGTLLTTFVLIPSIGVTAILKGLGASLFALSVLLLLPGSTRRVLLGLIPAIMVACAALAASPLSGTPPVGTDPGIAPLGSRGGGPPRSLADTFSEARAWHHLETLCAMGPRAHGTEGQRRAQEYIRQRLQACAKDVRQIPFRHRGQSDLEPTSFTNIVGRFRSGREKWVLLGTHYDTRLWADEDPDAARRSSPIVGADDGGSGVAVLLEIAEVMSARRPDVGVELVFFDGEDYGRRHESQDYMLGSKVLAERFDEYFPDPRPACAVVVDMVGKSELRYLREETCEQTHRWVNDALWAGAGRLGYASSFASTGSRRVIDDHSALIEIGIPATLLLDFDYPQWHTASDTLDKCSAKSLGITGRTLIESLLSPRGARSLP